MIATIIIFICTVPLIKNNFRYNRIKRNLTQEQLNYLENL